MYTKLNAPLAETARAGCRQCHAGLRCSSMSRRKVRRQLLAGFQLAQRGSRGAGPTASAQCARGTQGGFAWAAPRASRR